MPSATVGLFDDVITFSVIVKYFYGMGVDKGGQEPWCA